MTQKQLNTFVASLVKLLNLDGWKIKTTIVEETETQDALAETSWQAEWKEAEIHILSPEYFAENSLSFRQFLIHELLHILFEGHKELEGIYEPPVEFAINTTSALIDQLLLSAGETSAKNPSKRGRPRKVAEGSLAVPDGSGIPSEESSPLQGRGSKRSRPSPGYPSEVPRPDDTGVLR